MTHTSPPAEGEAQAILLRAEAEAEALRIVSSEIANNPSLIPYLYVQNLSDNVNIALVPSNSPFLFDFAGLTDSLGTTTNALPEPTPRPTSSDDE